MTNTLNKLSSAVAAACLMAATGLASAQGTTAPAPAAPGGSATIPGAAPAMPAAGASGAMRSDQPMQAVKLVRMSKLDGVDVRDGGGKKIGEIDDVIVDPRSGDIRQVVVSTGGLAGIGESKHAMGIGDLKFHASGKDGSGRLHATSAQAPDQMPKIAKADRNSGVVMGDKLVGTDVLDVQGKEIGEIEDIVVDVSTGKAQYVLLEFDQSWSLVDKLFAFQMSSFQPAQKEGKLMLDVRKEQLDGAQSLSKRELDRADLSSVRPIR